jgi:hypothetical protein
VILARLFGWALLVVWLTWCFAIQARLGAGSPAAAWLPENGLVHAISVLAHLEEREGPFLVLALAVSRSAISSEPPVALLAGSLGLVLLGFSLRSVVELTGPLWRAVIAGGLVLVFDLWLALVHTARTLGAGPQVDARPLLAAAVSSAALALFAGPWLARLPGLTPLRSRRW